MRSYILAFSLVVAALAVANCASAATLGHVSHKTLAKVGLDGLQPMTDAQGTSVRGSGVATVSGNSTTTLLGSSSSQSYTGISSTTNAAASGSSHAIIIGFRILPTASVFGVYTGGGASATAK